MSVVRVSMDHSGSTSAKAGQHELRRASRARVLCATDALSRADAVVIRADTIARSLGAELLLLHVIDSAKPLRAARRSSSLASFILDAQARKMARAGGSAEISIRSGRPHDTIAQVAMEWGADLIVLGPYRRRVGDALRGTTAERIAHRTERPVLVVNRKAVKPYQHVLLTFDLTRMSSSIAQVTKQLGLLQGSQASVVHALQYTRPAMLYLSGARESALGEYQRSLSQLVSGEIAARLTAAGLDSQRFAIFSLQSSPRRAVEQVAANMAADLVVLGSSRFQALKRVFGSVSNDVLRTAKQDVLLISPAAARRVRRRTANINVRRHGSQEQPTRQLH